MREYARPMYSQKHYEDMAFLLNREVKSARDRNAIEAFLIYVFEQDNGKFDRYKFDKSVKGVK